MLLDAKSSILATIACALAVVACGEGGAPPRAAGEASESAAPRRGVVAIEVEAKKPGTKPFPFVFVEGKIGDRPTRFILDTGASVHALDAAIASAAGLGSPAKASLLSIDGWGTLPEHAVVVRELSATLRSHGIGGILSPQLLAEPGQAVVLDFVKRQLRTRPRAAAWSELGDIGPMLTAPGAKPCAAEAEGIGGVALVVDATIEGEATRLALDSGSSRTILADGSKAAAKVAVRPVLGRSIASAITGDVATSIYGGAPMAVGGWSTTLDLGIAPGEQPPRCGHEGRIGIDVLQQCAVAVTSEELLVACRGGH